MYLRTYFLSLPRRKKVTLRQAQDRLQKPTPRQPLSVLPPPTVARVRPFSLQGYYLRQRFPRLLERRTGGRRGVRGEVITQPSSPPSLVLALQPNFPAPPDPWRLLLSVERMHRWQRQPERNHRPCRRGDLGADRVP